MEPLLLFLQYWYFFFFFNIHVFVISYCTTWKKNCLVVVTLNLWDKVSVAMQTFSIVKDSVKANRL